VFFAEPSFATSAIIHRIRNNALAKLTYVIRAAARSKIQHIAQAAARSKIQHVSRLEVRSKIQHHTMESATSIIWQKTRYTAKSEIENPRRDALKIFETLGYVDPDFTDMVRMIKIAEKRTADFEDTKTGRNITSIENELKNKLTWVADKAKNRLANGKTISDVKAEFGQYVNDTITDSVAKSYQTGVDLVANATDTQPVISPIARDKILPEIEKFVKSFWDNLEQYTIKQPLVDDGFISKNPDIYDRIFGIAASIPTAILATSTILQLRQPAIPASDVFKAIQVTTTTQTPETQKVMWVTSRDDRVCPICEPLDGNIYDVNDENRPKPGPEEYGGNTHWGCRCKLAPVFGDEPWIQ
jgi:hypothetical protein